MLPFFRKPFSAVAAATALMILGGCKSDSTGSGGDPEIDIALVSSVLQLVQGGTTSATVNVTRSDFTGAVTLSAEGLPNGVTAASVTVPASEGQGTLAFNATSAATAGTSTITIRAAGTGVAAVTKTLSLTISQATSG